MSSRFTMLVAVLGCLVAGGALLLGPERAEAPALLAFVYLLGLGLSGVFFIALEYSTGATWSILLRRVPEAMTGVLPLAAAGLAILITSGSLHRFAADDLHGFKAFWLDRPFFLARSAIYLLSWLLLAWAIVMTSRRQDADGAIARTQRNRVLAAVFHVVFAVTLWLASFDWLMALDPHWHSTIFGVYNFAGLFLAGLAAITMLAIVADGRGLLVRNLTDDHFHDLGKLLFAFSTFWMYIWVSQYMLMWYANLPAEAAYYAARLRGPWLWLSWLNIAINWLVPFIVLLPRAAKRNRRVLGGVAAAILAGRWLDLYLLIYPAAGYQLPSFGLWEVSFGAAALAMFVGAYFAVFTTASTVPIRDPYLVLTDGALASVDERPLAKHSGSAHA